jgi:phage gpG-like protein
MSDANFNVTVNDGAVVLALRQMTEAVKMTNLEAAARVAAMPVMNEAKRLVRKRTGTLARSIQISVVKRTPNEVRVSVGTNLVYAKMVEYGGVITPKRARFLAWQTPSGEWIFARRVVRNASPYLRPAFANKQVEARAAAFAALTKLAGLTGGNRAPS